VCTESAGVPGLEPRLTEPESVVLPITPYPNCCGAPSPVFRAANDRSRPRRDASNRHPTPPTPAPGPVPPHHRPQRPHQDVRPAHPPGNSAPGAAAALRSAPSGLGARPVQAERTITRKPRKRPLGSPQQLSRRPPPARLRKWPHCSAAIARRPIFAFRYMRNRTSDNPYGCRNRRQPIPGQRGQVPPEEGFCWARRRNPRLTNCARRRWPARVIFIATAQLDRAGRGEDDTFQ
jgi:hypothetical protein